MMNCYEALGVDRKARRGKAVTLVKGFVGSSEDLRDLTRRLKKACGAGGSAKDGTIEIQGDRVEMVVERLRKMGFTAKT